MSEPSRKGHFGPYGGQYVAETLMPALQELEAAFEQAWADPAFRAEFGRYLHDYVGRPSPLYFAERLAAECGGTRIYLKREDLNHTGAHKVNNTLGQALLARRMGKPRLIAETGAGMHGVATATVAALFGMSCDVFMGTEDIERQQANVLRMKMLGARVVPVRSGSATLKDAMNEALRDWVTTVRNTFYVIGTVAGPHPYPTMVRIFQSVIGEETREQILEKEGRLPDEVFACVGGGSNAMGIFAPFVGQPGVSSSAARRPGMASRAGNTRPASAAARSVSSTATRRTCCRTTTARSPSATRSPPASTTPASAPSTPTSTTRAWPSTAPSPTNRPSTPSTACAGSKASFRPSSPRTPWPPPSNARRNARRIISWWSTSPDAATRIWRRCSGR